MKIQKYTKTSTSIILTLLLSYGLVSAWTNLSSVNTGDQLTATVWNDMATKLNDIGSRTDGIYNSSGNIGIGTSNSNSPLTVTDNIDNDGVSSYFVGRPLNTSDTRSYFTFVRNGASSWWGLAINSSNDFAIHNSGNKDYINFVASTGNVGIGTIAPTEKLEVVGNTTITGRIYNAGMSSGSSGYYVCKAANGELNYGASCSSSDRSLKENINTLDNSLDKISRLRGVSYYWNEKEKWRGTGRQIGVIAQEIEKEYPEVVSQNEKGIKSVNYEVMVGPLIESIKELKKENDSLKKQNEEILKRLEKLENK